MFYLAIEKYRVRDVARDFGFPAKVITDILGKYGEAPKSNMQALEDKELSVIEATVNGLCKAKEPEE